MNKIKLMQSIMNTKPDYSWYRMESKNDTTDVYIYDEISYYGVSADNFVKDINQVKSKTINLHINSPGGSVFDGIAIYNALKQHTSEIVTYIEGLAASSASIVALAGDKIYMAENAFYMIHEPWVLAVGDSTELRKTAELLDKIRSVMVTTYANKTQKDKEEIENWIKAETWFTAQEAKDAGFIDEITEQVDLKAHEDIAIYNNVPEQLIKAVQVDSKENQVIKQARESMRMRLELEG